MYRAKDFWAAIDQIAAEHHLTRSGLARAAGLDATTFNLSKRVKRDGHERWPASSSIARVLEATGKDLVEFARTVELCEQRQQRKRPTRRGGGVSVPSEGLRLPAAARSQTDSIADDR